MSTKSLNERCDGCGDPVAPYLLYYCEACVTPDPNDMRVPLSLRLNDEERAAIERVPHMCLLQPSHQEPMAVKIPDCSDKHKKDECIRLGGKCTFDEINQLVPDYCVHCATGDPPVIHRINLPCPTPELVHQQDRPVTSNHQDAGSSPAELSKQERIDEQIEELDRADRPHRDLPTDSVLHKLWTWSVGKEGYDKKLWKEMQFRLEDLKHDLDHAWKKRDKILDHARQLEAALKRQHRVDRESRAALYHTIVHLRGEHSKKPTPVVMTEDSPPVELPAKPSYSNYTFCKEENCAYRARLHYPHDLRDIPHYYQVRAAPALKVCGNCGGVSHGHDRDHVQEVHKHNCPPHWQGTTSLYFLACGTPRKKDEPWRAWLVKSAFGYSVAGYVDGKEFDLSPFFDLSYTLASELVENVNKTIDSMARPITEPELPPTDDLIRDLERIRYWSSDDTYVLHQWARDAIDISIKEIQRLRQKLAPKKRVKKTEER